MREAIQDYVIHEEARESFKREALASWTADQETGQHLTGMEMCHWLNNWGTDKETSIPSTVPRVIITAGAANGLERYRQFLIKKILKRPEGRSSY